MTDSEDGTIERTETVLYLESEQPDRTQAFCSAVLDDASEDDYRVVQLTSARSLESVRDSLDLQMDLTGISVAFSRLVDRWETAGGSLRICLRDVESLLPYHETDLVYRFLNTVLATLQGAGADVHCHLRPAALEEDVLDLFVSLFDRVVEADEPIETPADGTIATEQREPEAAETTVESSIPDDAETALEPDAIEVSANAMSDQEIDTFLEPNGHGVLAFGGDPPYAIPMSYGYHPHERDLYLHLGASQQSKKTVRLEQSDRVSFVVSRYDRPDQWRSVVVDGTLTRLSREEAQNRDVAEAYVRADLASVDVFLQDPAELSFDWYVLEPEAISGRQSDVEV